jgi:hypothetical protein
MFVKVARWVMLWSVAAAFVAGAVTNVAFGRVAQKRPGPHWLVPVRVPAPNGKSPAFFRPRNCVGSPNRGTFARTAGGSHARPTCGSDRCASVSISSSRDDNVVSTSVTWCGDGTNVTEVVPTGGDTSYSVGGGWEWWYWQKWSYCCVGNQYWYMEKIGSFTHENPYLQQDYTDCVDNNLYLWGDLVWQYGSNQGSWQKRQFGYWDTC